MSKKSVREFKWLPSLILILSFSIVALTLVMPSSFSPTNVLAQSSAKDRILIITNGDTNYSLAEKIQSEGPGIEENYTIAALETYGSLDTLLATINTESYHTLFFILQDIDEVLFSSEDVSVLTTMVSNGVSMAFISSQIGNTNEELIDLMGIEVLSEDIYESEEDNITFTIVNDTFLEFPYNFNIDQEFNSSAQIGFIGSQNINVTEIARTGTIEHANDTQTGIYLKNNGLDKGKILVVPLSFDETIENVTTSLLITLSYHVISWSTELQKHDIIVSSTTTEPSSNPTIDNNIDILSNLPNDLLLPSLTIVGILGLSVGSVAVGRKLRQSSKYSEEEEVWSVRTPVVSLILAPFLWIFA
ncbi:MAG: hypothetical protein ACTSPV_13595, partial [Candidatus Hodarchaeales archaeon]